MAYKDADMRGYVDIAWNYLIIIGLTWCKTWPIDLYLKYGGSVIKCWLYSGKCTWTYRSRSYFAKIDDVAPSDSIIVSSSSDITMSVIQSDCKHPEHCVIGHSFQSSTYYSTIRDRRSQRDIKRRYLTNGRFLFEHTKEAYSTT